MSKKKPASERKRAANGQGSISKRPDGRYKIDVSLGRDLVTGKAIRKSVYGWTEKEALAKAQKLQVEANEGIYKEPSKLTVKEWCEIWLKEYTGHLAQRTKELYEGDVNNYIIPRLGRHKLRALNRAMIQQFVNSITEDPLREGKPVAGKTVENIHGTLNRLLNQAVDIDYIKVNPASKPKLPRTEPSEVRAMSRQEMMDFVKHIQGHKYELPYLFDLYTGLREGELLGLQWDSVDLEGGKITVRQQMQKTKAGYVLMPPKGNKIRTVPIGEQARAVLQRQKRQQAEWRLRAGAVWQDSGYVFTNEIGEHIKRQTIYKQYKDAVTAIGAPDLDIHSMRHTYATTSMQAGVDIKNLQTAMGHSSAAFTLARYGHAMQDMHSVNTARFEALFNDITSEQK